MHQYFYHATLTSRVASIRREGLSPRFESSDSSYGNRRREPVRAMRFCTKKFPDLARSAARTRAQTWSDSDETLIASEKVVVLRTRATSLLDKSFGLDHSFAPLNAVSEEILSLKERFTPDEFIQLVERYGSIACYETIPPDELEVGRDGSLSFDGEFVVLTSYVA